MKYYCCKKCMYYTMISLCTIIRLIWRIGSGYTLNELLINIYNNTKIQNDYTYTTCPILLTTLIFILETGLLSSAYISNKIIRFINYSTLLIISSIVVLIHSILINISYNNYSLIFIICESITLIHIFFILMYNSKSTTNIIVPFNTKKNTLKDLAAMIIQAKYRQYKIKINVKKSKVDLEIINDGIV